MSERPKPISRADAVAQVLQQEDYLRSTFRHFSADTVAWMSAKRVRAAYSNPDLFAQTPIHQMMLAVEASCAYFDPADQWGLDERRFISLFPQMNAFSDPALTHSLLATETLTCFLAQMHRTQLDYQRSLWAIPVSRAFRLATELGGSSRLVGAFQRAFGYGPLDWLRTALVVYSGACIHDDKMAITPQYLVEVGKYGPGGSIAARVLDDMSTDPGRVKQAYLALRAKGNPLDWYQRRSTLSHRPILKLGDKWAVPFPSLVANLFGDAFFEQVASMADATARQEWSNAFVSYLKVVLRHHFPRALLLEERMLQAESAAKVCDLAVEFADAVLLIEAKTTLFNRELITEKSLRDGANELIDGGIQIAQTADRIAAGGSTLPANWRSKQVLGVVVTLGEHPQANADDVWDSYQDKIAKSGCGGKTLSPNLKHRPAVLSIEAFERLCMHLYIHSRGLSRLFDEKAIASRHTFGDWPRFLEKKNEQQKFLQKGFWQGGVDDILRGWGLTPGESPRSKSKRQV